MLPVNAIVLPGAFMDMGRFAASDGTLPGILAAKPGETSGQVRLSSNVADADGECGVQVSRVYRSGQTGVHNWTDASRCGC